MRVFGMGVKPACAARDMQALLSAWPCAVPTRFSVALGYSTGWAEGLSGPVLAQPAKATSSTSTPGAAVAAPERRKGHRKKQGIVVMLKIRC